MRAASRRASAGFCRYLFDPTAFSKADLGADPELALDERVKGPLVWRSAAGRTLTIRARSTSASNAAIVFRNFCGEARFLFESSSFALSTGDVLIAEGARCRGVELLHGVDCEWLQMPAILWASFHPAAASPRIIRQEGATAAEMLVLDYLESWRENFDDVTAPSAPQLLDVLGRLVAMAAPETLRQSAPRGALLSRAQAMVAARLADAELSPDTVATALGISLRSLHALYEPTGETFAAHVRRRRLEECRVALTANPDRRVGEIALAWGFRSLASFYRAFHAAYGAAPGAFQAPRTK